MFNLNLATAKSLAAKAISSGPVVAASSGQTGSEGGGVLGQWSLSRTSKAPGADTVKRLRARAPTHRDRNDDDDDLAAQDPLIYRLQHQKQYREEKSHEKCQSLRRSRSGRRNRRGARERDPFDLGGSFTSESDVEFLGWDSSSSHKLETDDSDDVDVVGWGSNRSGSRPSEEDEGSTSELYVDFGGVTPIETKRGKGMHVASSDEIAFHEVAAPIPSPLETSRSKRLSKRSTDSSFSSVTNMSANDNLCITANGEEDACQPPKNRPSQEDLALILSSLESYVEQEAFEPEPVPKPKADPMSCSSSLSSPTSKYRHSLSNQPTSNPLEQNTAPPPPLPFSSPHDQQSNQSLQQSPTMQSSIQHFSPSTSSEQPQKQEEDDPKLAQLKQQTTEELRTELAKMQAQSKTNLEQSWAEAERMRVESSELDDKLLKVENELTSSRAALSVWQMKTQTIHDTNSICSSNSGTPKPMRSKSTANLTKETDTYSSSLTNCLEFSRGFVAKSYSNKKNYSAGASNALREEPCHHQKVLRSQSDSGSGNGNTTKKFLAGLGKSFRGITSTGYTTNHNDSDRGFGISIDDDDESSSSSFDDVHENQDFMGRNPKPMLSTNCSAPQTSNVCIDQPEDDISENMSAMPPPSPLGNNTEPFQNSQGSLLESASTEFAEMEDFDFDPLQEDILQGANDRSATGKEKQRKGFVRRPSFMNLFEGSSDEDENSIVFPSRRKEDMVSAVKSLILEKENEVGQLLESIQAQAEDVRECEVEISRANKKCTEDGAHFKTNELKLQEDIEQLEHKSSQNESKLQNAEDSEQKARQKEHSLKEQVARLKQEQSDAGLRNQFCSYQEQFNSSQEKAISSLSSLLNDFDAISIPSLRGEMEDDVCGDIISLFDALTDKEEELVMVLSDAGRLTACQASFKQIQKNIEIAIGWQQQLGDLETDLHHHLMTIAMLIKHDDEGTHTTESSTASERLSLERVFVEAVVLHLGSVKQKQGKLILDALFKSVELLTSWDQWLLPDVELSPPPHRSFNGDLGACLSTISMLKNVVENARTELSAVKSDVLNERSKFRAKMQRPGYNNDGSSSAGLLYYPNSNVTVASCNFNATTKDDNSATRVNCQEEPRKVTDYEAMNKEISQQINVAETLLSERESMLNKYTHLFRPMQFPAQELETNLPSLEGILEEGTESEQLEELDKQISNGINMLSEKESLMTKYSFELGLMQAQALKDSKANAALLNGIQLRIKHILVKLAEEESMIASLHSLLREKRENCVAGWNHSSEHF